ncbi:MAG: hypothetical protein EOP85_07450 [Verrucomicrobiaceae bacterium]|nr:MAG: hypothetical protein EOP85_07450 [Verrucomicrobiaceae bacterium]
MSGWLRSWKLCEVAPQTLDGVAGWRKQRLVRAAFLIPPGNIFLRALQSGCRMLGTGWAENEVRVFRQTHDDVPPALCLGAKTIWLPHLPGSEVRKSTDAAAFSSAFSELGRFHRLGLVHGDPHAGNFLYDAGSRRCRIIDFETTPPPGMDMPQARARDFAILALDLWKHGKGSADDFTLWREAYGSDEGFCPVARLFCAPGFPLRQYWKWLGYKDPCFPMAME